MELEGRVVVVTGAGSGIGAALARATQGAGARHVVVADRDGPAAELVAASIGGTAAVVDVTDEDAIVDLVTTTEAAHGPIGLFCSNAGFLTSGGLEEPNATIDAMWNVHVMAHIYAARAVVPSMAANGGGYLLNTASAAGLLCQLDAMAYSVTKGAAVSFAQWLAIAHRHHGIGVSVLCPQAVRTNLLANSPDRYEGRSLDWVEGGVASSDGVLDPDEVASCCLEAVHEERFLVLPHPEVGDYLARRGTDIDRWLSGMRRFQDTIYAGTSRPGDAFVAGLAKG